MMVELGEDLRCSYLEGTAMARLCTTLDYTPSTKR